MTATESQNDGLSQPLAASLRTLTCRGGSMSFFSFDGPIGDSLEVYGEWAQVEIDFLARFISPGGVVIDAGANVGTHTLAFSRLVGETGRVYSIEAQPQVFHVLQKNVAQNGLRNVLLCGAAVSGAAGSLDVPALDPTQRQNVGAVSLAAATAAPDQATLTVSVETLDSICTDPVQLLKLDVEGMELDVLRGAQGLLARGRPLIYLECNDLERGWDIVKFLRRADYTAFFCRFPAFNPVNFRGNSENFFGVAEESALLFVPQERLEGATAALAGLAPMTSLDSLAAALSTTPRYGDHTAYDRDPAQLRHLLADATSGPDRETSAVGAGRDSAPDVAQAQARVRAAVDRALALALPNTTAAPLDCQAVYEILIPIYNAYDHVKRCVESVLRHTDARHPVVLLDDASPDERILPLLRGFEQVDPRVRLLTSERNLGFIGNVNRGFALSSHDVVILNSDTEVTPRWLERLDRCRDSHPAIGVVSPLSNNATILSVPIMNHANRLPDGMSAGDFAALVAEVSPRAYPRLPTAVGFCMLITRSALERTGLFDPAFGLGYGEETDFCMRAWQRGIETACCDDAYVHHYGEASFSGVEQIDRRRRDNARLMAERWPRYDTAVQVFCHHNPLRVVQERIQAALNRRPREPRPHILHVIHSFDVPGGTELHTRNLIDGLAARYRSTVMYPGRHHGSKAHDYIDYHVEQRAEHLRVAELRGRNVVAQESFLGIGNDLENAVVEGNFVRFLAGGDYATVHFQHLAYWDTLMLPLVAKALGKRVIVSLHDYYLLCPEYNLILPEYTRCGRAAAGGDDPECLRCLSAKRELLSDTPRPLGRYLSERHALVRRVLEAADVLIAPSVFVRDQFQRAFGAALGAKIRVIPHGTMVTTASPRPPRGRRLRVGFLGNLTDRKGAHTVLAAVERLQGEPVEIQVFGGVPDTIKERATALGIKQHGNYKHAELPRLLEQVDVVIIPSVWDESYCMTVSEAQAMGVPVIAAAVGAIPERIVDGVTGFLIPPADPRALAQRLLDLANDPASLLRVQEALSRFVPKTMADNVRDYDALYAELLHDRDPSRGLMRDLLGLADELPPTQTKERLANAYADWNTARLANAPAFARLQDRVEARPQPLFHLLMVLPAALIARLPDTLDSLAAQGYPRWRLSIVSDAPPPSPEFSAHPALKWVQAEPAAWLGRVNAVAMETAADWTGLIGAGDRLDGGLLLHCADYIQRHPAWRFLYTDEDKMGNDGRGHEPALKPDVNLEWLRAQAYIGRFALVRRDSLLALEGYACLEGMEAYDAALRVIERWGVEVIGHLPHVLYHRLEGNAPPADRLTAAGMRLVSEHLARCGVAAKVQPGLIPGAWHVDYALPRRPRAAVVVYGPVPMDVLAETVGSVLEKTAYPDLRIGLYLHGHDAEAAAALQTLAAPLSPRVTVLELPQDVADLEADYLVFMRAGTLVVQAQWLERMLALAVQPAVGIVGARVIGGDQCIAGIGKTLGLGPDGVAAPLQPGLAHTAPGYLGRAQVAQDLAAVAGDCLLIDKGLYDDIGLDLTAQGLHYRDVDICLHARRRGRRVVWSPHATVFSRYAGAAGTPAADEVDVMLTRWLPQLADDPAFHPALCMQRPDVVLEGDFPPWAPRDNHDTPRILGMAFGSPGSWEYRGAQPLAALARHGLARAGSVAIHRDRVRVPTPTELARLGADSLLLYNTLHDAQLEALRQYRRFNRVFIAFGQDDLLTALPAHNPMRATLYKDVRKRLRTCLSLSDRLIVTTAALAHHLRGYIDDIRVLPNRLGPQWTGLKSRRRAGAKARVGWAGALQHAGDLRLLIEVVKATAGEVDWVFMGMCPESIRSYAKEFHGPVPFEHYPATLASLNLDIALAPLEHNSFNEAKSNLRLLEYGALGWTVICTDIEPYREAPVTRVPNTTRAWVAAIRERVADLDAAEREGARLHEWVRNGWMLDDHVQEWLDALRPEAVEQPRHAAHRDRAAGLRARGAMPSAGEEAGSALSATP